MKTPFLLQYQSMIAWAIIIGIIIWQMQFIKDVLSDNGRASSKRCISISAMVTLIWVVYNGQVSQYKVDSETLKWLVIIIIAVPLITSIPDIIQLFQVVMGKGGNALQQEQPIADDQKKV
jgi:hypothetical protein